MILDSSKTMRFEEILTPKVLQMSIKFFSFFNI